MTVAGKGRDFRELKVWEKSHRLTLEVYKVTASFPREEMFGLTSQARRSSSSIPANIAEGCGRGGGELQRFCRIAFGSASELEYHLILAHDLQMIELDTFDQLSSQVTEVKKMLSGFLDKLTADS
jgi:four helix bundle protein